MLRSPFQHSETQLTITFRRIKTFPEEGDYEVMKQFVEPIVNCILLD